MNAENTQAIKEYSQTEAALAELRAQYQGVVFEVNTAKGDKAAREARQTLVKLRTALEAKRKEIKAPALAHAKAIDTEAARITAAIRELEEPIDAMIRAEETRKAAEKAEKERIERERVDGIKAKIDAIRNLPVASANDAAAELGSTLADLQAFEASVEVFAEFTVEAASVQGQTIDTLKRMHAQAVAREEEAARAAAERAELERQRREQEEREALAKAAQEEEARKLAAEREAFEREKAEAAAKEQAARDEEARKLEAERAELARQKAEFEAQQRAQAEAEVRKAEEERQKQIEEQQRALDTAEDREIVAVEPSGTTCPTCRDHGMIGGPSYYAPDEGGAPCPDCQKDDAQRAVDYAEAPAPQPHNAYSFQNMQAAPGTWAACKSHSWLIDPGHPQENEPCPECAQDAAVAATQATPSLMVFKMAEDGNSVRERTYTADEMRAAFIAGWQADGIVTDADLDRAATAYVAGLEG